MEAENVSILYPTSSNVTPPGISDSGRIIEEGPRICPLCSSIVRLFFINFNEKLLMCENTECEFPFGYEDLHFVKEDSEVQSDVEIISQCKFSQGSSTATCSVVSAAAWSDIDKINKANDSEDSQMDAKALNSTSNNREVNLKKRIAAKENEEQLLKNIDNIKHLNTVLVEREGHPKRCIQNEKWIRNLKNLQELSGVQLLRKPEIDKLKSAESSLGLGELKIDIDTESDNISSIKIEIANKEKNM